MRVEEQLPRQRPITSTTSAVKSKWRLVLLWMSPPHSTKLSAKVKAQLS